MRLVSALWGSYYPFASMDLFDTFFTTANPDELKPDDVLLVWGGEDIHPSLYGRSLSPQTGAPSDGPARRCREEWALMQRAKQMGLYIIGICRGAQMLCALSGGILFQHVTNHGGRHTVQTFDNKKIMVNSLHHQMMVPKNTNHELVAWMPEKVSRVYVDENREVPPEDVEVEPEFIYFPDVKGFAIQWHPEMMEEHTEANRYVMDYIQGKINGRV